MLLVLLLRKIRRHGELNSRDVESSNRDGEISGRNTEMCSRGREISRDGEICSRDREMSRDGEVSPDGEMASGIVSNRVGKSRRKLVLPLSS